MTAPADGYVVNWQVQEGTMLVPAPVAAAGTFIDTSELPVIAAFPQNYLVNVKPGNEVELVLDPKIEQQAKSLHRGGGALVRRLINSSCGESLALKAQIPQVGLPLMTSDDAVTPAAFYQLTASCLPTPVGACKPNDLTISLKAKESEKDKQWPRTRFAYGTTRTLRLLLASTPRPFSTAGWAPSTVHPATIRPARRATF
jgi:hypothetical protein